ncbi:U1 small nuclear ribonucleoprotein 70 kDa-like [Limulus polyphemus]|uniref:U1 small nuclear ribonucleoprotein 70 kDa n=1 Tax=Limulus polyphemus TaxID=6850 RepID=A0ABM1AZM7_LIMPO|nr:U1 small nuclear ribonucleoprotein 70 kDa-like [Limulus polyphemus]
MTQFLPPNLLALFAPRDPIPYLIPVDKLPHEKNLKGLKYTGVGSFLADFEDPKETPPPTRIETREERQERKRREKAEQTAYKLEQDIALWDPHNDTNGTSDPYKTLFIARINYDSSESKLRREFEVYGPIKKIVLVHDNTTGKPRGYAFIEYEHERDMHSAYKHADGKKIDGRRVLVDVERGRTVKGWLPRRLGGGLGGTRRGGPDVNVKHSGRDDGRMDEKYLSDRGDRERERERRRSRSRSRERRKRSRSRDRYKDRRRDRERPAETPLEGNNEVVSENDKRKRSRSRERDRKRRRSRSRERKKREKEREGRRDKDGRVKVEPVLKPEISQDGYSSSSMGYDGGDFNYNADSAYDVKYNNNNNNNNDNNNEEFAEEGF